MLKHLFLNTTAIRCDANNDAGNPDPKIALREQIAKGNLPTSNVEVKDGEKNEEVKEGDDEENDDGDGEKEEDKVKDPPEETPEAKAEREAAEKIATKATRKNDRMQRRIDEAIAAKKTAEDALKAFKEANPDVKLTDAEVEARADALAAKKMADKTAQEIQTNFDNACAKLAKEATKIDNKFGDKVEDMAEQFGPIPSFMIGVLEDFENGAEVLALMANDDDIAEKIYNLKNSPAKMTKELVLISNKLIDDKKKKDKKQISKVPDTVEPVNGSRHVSTVITEADTKDMDSYVAKRRAQQEASRKARGY